MDIDTLTSNYLGVGVRVKKPKQIGYIIDRDPTDNSFLVFFTEDDIKWIKPTNFEIIEKKKEVIIEEYAGDESRFSPGIKLRGGKLVITRPKFEDDSLNVQSNIAPVVEVPEIKVTGGGLRFDSGKLDLNYCPLSSTIAIASVFSANSEENGGKYPDYNWLKGQSWSKPLASAIRHINKFKSGELTDEETGLPHLWLAQTNLAMLIEYSYIFPEGNNLPAYNKIKSAGFEEMLPNYQNALEKNKLRKGKNE